MPILFAVQFDLKLHSVLSPRVFASAIVQHGRRQVKVEISRRLWERHSPQTKGSDE